MQLPLYRDADSGGKVGAFILADGFDGAPPGRTQNSCTLFLTILPMASKQEKDDCIMDEYKLILSTLFVMITVTRIFPLSFNQSTFLLFPFSRLQ